MNFADKNVIHMQNMCIIFAAFVTAIILGSIIIPNILIISLRKRLFDEPDARKVHKRPIPRLGGVTFFPVILCTSSFFIAVRFLIGNLDVTQLLNGGVTELLFLISGLTLLYVIGIADDLIGVRYRKKFLVQIISASFFPLAGLTINNFYGLFGIYEIPAYIGIPFTVLLAVFITNAINLIDGIDGLASSLSMIALAVLGIIFMIKEEWEYALLAFVCVGIIIPFFTYNVFGNADRGRKIFMGDTGSLTLGYILSFFVIKYCMYTGSVPAENLIDSPILVCFSILLVPSLDVVRVVLRRARNGKSLFKPDKTHIHHKFLDMGFSPRKALISIQLMSAGLCLFTLITVHQGWDDTLVFIIDVLVWSGLNLWFDKVIKDKKNQNI